MYMAEGAYEWYANARDEVTLSAKLRSDGVGAEALSVRLTYQAERVRNPEGLSPEAVV